jgi:hypothetical protein
VIGEILELAGPFLFFAFVGAAICGLAGGVMLDRVGRGLAGALLGFFLGPIGLLIAWVVRDNALRDEEAKDRARRHHQLDRADVALSAGRRASPAVHTSNPPMSAVADLDALERLARLHRAGDLTDEEFAAAKRRILAAPASTVARAPPPPPERRFR